MEAMNELITIIEKFGIPTLWGYLMYLLVKEMVNKMFNGFNQRMNDLIEELREIKEELRELKDDIKTKV